MDGTPDNDHGANSVNALQSMLLQSNGNKIFLLPAWPENWDVSFKLCATNNTTVECEYKDGKVQTLKVTPETRRADIIDKSTLRERIRTLTEAAQCDRNYLFGLPPMLDARPIPGKITAPWILKYGNTIEGSKAGPWPNTLFKGNIVFVHKTDWPAEGIRLGKVPRKLIVYKSVTGDIHVTEDEKGWLLSGTPDPLSTIVRLEFDRSVAELAYALPSIGSLTLGKKPDISTDQAGRKIIGVNLDGEKKITRFEFTIENPGYLRGKGKSFELQSRQTDKTWKTIYTGTVYGTICSKQLDPVNATEVRLIITASRIKQFDLF